MQLILYDCMSFLQNRQAQDWTYLRVRQGRVADAAAAANAAAGRRVIGVDRLRVLLNVRIFRKSQSRIYVGRAN